jgi:flavin-dependent dehydrogenase
MNERVDVFVVGGGPAGVAAAIAARQRGFSVMLADGGDYPIDKSCGEGLHPEAQMALSKLNIRIPKEIGFDLRGIRFVQDEMHVSANYSNGVGLGIRRTVLHELLVSSAESCGVKMLWKTPVVATAVGGVDLKKGRVSARWIIGADGGASRVRRWSGLDATSHREERFACRRHYRVKPWSDYMEIYWGRGAQGYVTPVSRDEVCVVILSKRPQDANFDESLNSMQALKKRLAGAELSSRERGGVTAMHRLERVTHANVALVGDASGGVDAITGEGLRLAFCQAMVLAEGLERGDLRDYQRIHRQLLLRPTWMGNLLLLMARNTLLRDRVLKSLSVRPELFTEFLAIHTGGANPSAIVSAGARLGWGLLAA